MDKGSTIIIVIIMIILYEYQNRLIYEYFTSANIVSPLDQRSYKVVSGFADSDKASIIMSQLNKFIIELLRFLKNKFIINGNGLPIEQNFVTRVLNNYNPDTIFENNPRPGEDTSYVVNKGQKFGICLRNKTNSNIHDNGILEFVIIHELTHLGTITYGHDFQFWSWMKFMLFQAYEAGLYVPVNYSLFKTKYCGIPVTFNPFFSSEYNWTIAEAN